jgi:carbon starvation protein
LLVYGYAKIWPIFGSANQLLAGLALLAVTVWLANTGKNYMMTMIPMIFMFAVTLTALVLLIRNFFGTGSILLGVIAVFLFILAIVLIYTAYSIMKNKKSKDLSA